MPRRRAMTSEVASLKKIAGHVHEDDFANLIGGSINKGTQTNKKDVIDSKHRIHSVKGGEWWQIFLYGRNRFQTNTAFRGLGNISNLMISCIDAFPGTFDEYRVDKKSVKLALQRPMRLLCEELDKPNIFPAFLNKAMFNGGEVDYLVILPKEYADSSIDKKVFHVFEQSGEVDILSNNLEILNSRARQKQQMDAQKVIFRTTRNIGEIEIRTDSKKHYRQAKCRFNGPDIFKLLCCEIRDPTKPIPHFEG